MPKEYVEHQELVQFKVGILREHDLGIVAGFRREQRGKESWWLGRGHFYGKFVKTSSNSGTYFAKATDSQRLGEAR